MAGTMVSRHNAKRSAQKPEVQRTSPSGISSTFAKGLGPAEAGRQPNEKASTAQIRNLTFFATKMHKKSQRVFVHSCASLWPTESNFGFRIADFISASHHVFRGGRTA